MVVDGDVLLGVMPSVGVAVGGSGVNVRVADNVTSGTAVGTSPEQPVNESAENMQDNQTTMQLWVRTSRSLSCEQDEPTNRDDQKKDNRAADSSAERVAAYGRADGFAEAEKRHLLTRSG